MPRNRLYKTYMDAKLPSELANRNSYSPIASVSQKGKQSLLSTVRSCKLAEIDIKQNRQRNHLFCFIASA